ncbi:MAG TPA: hypothetical protein VEC19_06655 [Usitatibacter sp.]|nr:hypothetical protein [Usitatibacter sp.]
MPLHQWIPELNAATTEEGIVGVVASYVKHVRKTSSVPQQCLPTAPDSVAGIRRAAAALAHCRFDSTDPVDREAYQQLLIFLSLAVDRIAMLEARGILLPLVNAFGMRRPGLSAAG